MTSWRKAVRLAVFGSGLCAAAIVSPAIGQQPVLPDGLGLEHGAMLFHGNYCGPGNRAPLPPIDALDRACMHHDACSPDVSSGKLPRCACNARLRQEATLVARSRHQPDDMRALAETVASGAALLPCENRPLSARRG